MSFEEMQERDWGQIRDELRVLVTTAGFSQWDESFTLAINDMESQSQKQIVILYLKEFIKFLNVRSTSSLNRMRTQLSDLVVQDDEKSAVQEVGIMISEGTEVPMFEGLTTDDILTELHIILDALLEGRDEVFD